ncbi:MAG: hypothetical protein ABSF10_14325 [Verrucomicrobiota bacterium]
MLDFEPHSSSFSSLVLEFHHADYDYEDEEEDEKKNISQNYSEARYQTGEMSWNKGAPPACGRSFTCCRITISTGPR